MSMTFDQVADLLGFCALHDKRKGDSNDVDAWLVVANDFGWTWDAAFRVAREHYGQGADRPRLEAPAITDRIKAIRRQAAATFVPPPAPEHLYDKPVNPAWHRAHRDAHVDALVARWASSGEEPPVQLPPAPPPNRLGQRKVAELTAGAFQSVPGEDIERVVEETVTRRSALAAPCPHCNARPNEQCTRPGAGGRVALTKVHPARIDNFRTEEAS